MDRLLRRLKRETLEEAAPLTLAQRRYITALERVAFSGEQPADHPHLIEPGLVYGNVAAWVRGWPATWELPPWASNYPDRELSWLRPNHIVDYQGTAIGWLLDVDWEIHYDETTEEGATEIAETDYNLSPGIRQLLADAANLGYNQIIYYY